MAEGLSAAARPANALIDIIRGYQWSQALYVAARLGIADLLAAGPRDSADLAEVTETHAPSLYRLLRALSSLGVFDEIEQGRFALAALGEPLRSDVPTSARAELIMWADPALQWAPWGSLLYSVQTDERAF